MIKRYECKECSQIMTERDIVALYSSSLDYRGFNAEFYCKKCWKEKE